MSITAEEFSFVSKWAKNQAAIVLHPGKEYLVENRLSPIAELEGFGDVNTLIDELRKEDYSNPIQAKCIDALTTNETSFFRDHHPFEFLKTKVIPEIIRNKSRKSLNIWSAACSTGQEIYSTAMMLKANFPQLEEWDVKLFATDISESSIEKAKKGSYSQFEVNRGLPAFTLLKNFTQDESQWQLNQDIIDMVEFKKLNIIKPWPIMDQFDIIMLRNILIYFDVDTKKAILDKMSNCIHPNGYMLIGTSETVLNISDCWTQENEMNTAFSRLATSEQAGSLDSKLSNSSFFS